ncbi:hypothetical protein SynA1562_01813 [Synechococcus sp. A15-62]|nr:hypothetical protein SynA1562_01813 [Synechococcus sp. A15-62]
MPQGVVRDDGCLIQAQALKSACAAPAFGGGFFLLECSPLCSEKKKRCSLT